MDEFLRILTSENFAMIIAAFLIWNFTRDLKKELSSLHESITAQTKEIARQSKSVLLLVLAENGTKDKAKEMAKKMIEKSNFDEELE